MQKNAKSKLIIMCGKFKKNSVIFLLSSNFIGTRSCLKFPKIGTRLYSWEMFGQVGRVRVHFGYGLEKVDSYGHFRVVLYRTHHYFRARTIMYTCAHQTVWMTACLSVIQALFFTQWTLNSSKSSKKMEKWNKFESFSKSWNFDFIQEETFIT